MWWLGLPLWWTLALSGPHPRLGKRKRRILIKFKIEAEVEGKGIVVFYKV